MDQKTRRTWTSLIISLALAILFLVAGHTVVRSARPSLLPDAPEQAPRSPNAASGWRSAWISITPGANITLTHNLGGDPDSYAVKLWFRDQDGDYGINARGYGGLEDGGDFYGAAWMNLSSNTIQVGRSISDTFADQVRVWVWIPDPAPDYCSVWTNLGVGETGVFTHGLGGDVDDYFSSLVFSSTLSGINQRAYGGFEYNSGSYAGAYWSNLTTSTVQVYRHANDPFASQVRVCVTQPDPPDYDSGWITVTGKSTETFAHNLGGMVSLYRVRLDVWTPVFGINHRFAGGEMENVSPVGDNWQNLTNSTVQVYNHISSSRRVRLRIWDRNLKVYLPLVLNNYTPPTELAYDDGVTG